MLKSTILCAEFKKNIIKMKSKDTKIRKSKGVKRCKIEIYIQ